MNRLILASGSTFAVGAGSSLTTVFGTTSNETLSIGLGAKVVLDASFNRGGDTITLAGNASSYSARQSGSSVILTDASGSEITIPVGVTGAQVAFADAAARTLVFNTQTNAITLGADVVDSSADNLTSGTGGSGAGVTIPLTANLDAGTAFTGTSRNDIFSGNTSTLTVGDDLSGGAGVDTLSLSANLTDPVSIGGFRTSSIETLTVSVQDGDTANAEALTLNMLNAAVGKVSLSGLSTTLVADSLTLNNLAAGASLELTSAANLKLNANYVSAATEGTADSVSLALTDVSSAAAGDTVVTVGTGFETLNISTDVAAAVLGDVVFNGSRIVVTGNQNLTVRSALDNTVTDIDASAFTGRLSLVTSALANEKPPGSNGFDVVDLTITTGSGNDTLDLGSTADAEEVLINTGAGNDTVTIGADLTNAGTTTAGDVLNGGAGADTLVADVDLVDTLAITSARTGVSGFETLRLNGFGLEDNTVTVANVSADLNAVTIASAIDGATARGLTLAFGTAGSYTVNVGGAAAILQGDTLTATAAGTGTADALAIRNTNVATGTDQIGDANTALVATGFETVTIDTGSYSTRTAQLVNTVNVGAANTLVLQGANGLTTTNTTGVITAAVIDASAMTGALTMGAAAASGLTTLTGGAGNDTLRGDAASTINGGAGNDSITGGTGNDTLNGDAGNDTINPDAGTADTVNGGDGNDTIVFGAELGALDKVEGGLGTDTISLTNASLSTLRGLTISEANTFNDNFNNVERLLLTDALDQTSFDMGFLSGVTTVRLEAGISGNEILAGLDSGATVDLAARVGNGSTLTASVNNASTGTADALTLVLSSNTANVDYDDVAVANVETLTINVTQTTASADVLAARVGVTLTQATGGAAQTVLVTGTESLTVDTALAAGTIDASGMTVALAADNGLTMLAGASIAQTITGSGKVDTLVGSTRGDTINGGGGNDTISGRTGADVIDGGAGTDTITTAGMVGADIEGAATGESTGVVINLGTTAVAAGTINAATGDFLGGGLSSVAAGSAAYLFNTESSLHSAVTDTITNVENVTLSGNGTNYVVGSDAANTITGGTGVDVILGGAGNDVLIGGAGNDRLTGGTGVDTFRAAATTGSDVITDFTAGAGGDVFAFAAADLGNGNNTIDVGELVIHNAAVADLAAAVTFVQTNTNTTGTLFAIFVTDTDAGTSGNQSATVIYYDANPNVDGGETVLATMTNITTLTGHNALTQAANFSVFA